jgi:hypothetical protein
MLSLKCRGTTVPIPKFASVCGASDANFGIKGTLASYDSSVGFGFEVPSLASRLIVGTSNPPH